MKKILKSITFLFLSGLMITSCSLDEEPYGFYSEDNFYQTKEDAEAALYYAYDALTFIGYSRQIFTFNCVASDLYTTKDGSKNLKYDTWEFDASSEKLTDYFTYAYMGINRANAVIENTPEANFSENFTNHIVGQAYFLRAWNYFNLVKNFGLVPIHKSLVDKISETDANLPDNMDQMYDFIIEDLQKADSMLTVNRVYGLADQVAAQSLLSKVYLTIASSKENGVPLYSEMNRQVSQMYQKASEHASRVLYEQSEYFFDNNLLNIYNVEKPNGPEHIFILSMDRTGPNEGDYSKFSKMFISYINGSTVYLENPDGSLVKTHDGWSEYQPTDKLINSFQPGDKRKNVLMVDEVYDSEGNSLGTVSDGTIQYPFTRKYVDPEFISDKTSTKPYLIRFSEVALIYSEAQGPTSEGYKWINRIRNRAGIDSLETGLSESAFRDSVIKERSWELSFEGHRLYDLRRTNRVKQEVSQASGLSDMEATYFPLPQREINLNSQIEQ